VGDGNNTFFWADRWLHSQSITALALNVVNRVLKKFIRCRAVRDALGNNKWVADISAVCQSKLSRNTFSYRGCYKNFSYSQEQQISTIGLLLA
jgi:ACT domain-containing protein